MNWNDDSWSNSGARNHSRPRSSRSLGLILLGVVLCAVVLYLNRGFLYGKPPSGEGVSIIATDLIVHGDGNIDASETTRVDLRGKSVRHGITRPLPLQVETQDGRQLKLRYFDAYATIEKVDNPPYAPSTTDVAREDRKNFAVYRIGSPTTALLPGLYDIKFQFGVSGLVHSLQENQRRGFSWNVTGSVGYPVGESVLRISLPSSVDPHSASFTGFLGVTRNPEELKKAYNPTSLSSDISMAFEPAANGDLPMVVFRPNRYLRPFEQFIIKATWPAE
ncbi:MAG: hypothetical protein J0M12_15700 [Deltaproteobacteria bacterium]|nr:hypothetical protein [Deltaproteobacteria bacterium]